MPNPYTVPAGGALLGGVSGAAIGAERGRIQAAERESTPAAIAKRTALTSVAGMAGADLGAHLASKLGPGKMLSMSSPTGHLLEVPLNTHAIGGWAGGVATGLALNRALAHRARQKEREEVRRNAVVGAVLGAGIGGGGMAGLDYYNRRR